MNDGSDWFSENARRIAEHDVLYLQCLNGVAQKLERAFREQRILAQYERQLKESA